MAFCPLRITVRWACANFNITDKVIIIFVRMTDINRRRHTHKGMIVMSLKGGSEAIIILYRLWSHERVAIIKG